MSSVPTYFCEPGGRVAGYSAFHPRRFLEDALKSAHMEEARRALFSQDTKRRELLLRRAEQLVEGGSALGQAVLLEYGEFTKEEWARLEQRACLKIKSKSSGSAAMWLTGAFAKRGWQGEYTGSALEMAAADAQAKMESRWAAESVLVWNNRDWKKTELLERLSKWRGLAVDKSRGAECGWMLSAFVHHEAADQDVWLEVAKYGNYFGMLALACHGPSRRNKRVENDIFARLPIGGWRYKGVIFSGSAAGRDRERLRAWLALDADDDSFWQTYQWMAEEHATDAVELLKKRASEGSALDTVTLSMIMDSPVTRADSNLRRAAISLVGAQRGKNVKPRLGI